MLADRTKLFAAAAGVLAAVACGGNPSGNSREPGPRHETARSPEMRPAAPLSDAGALAEVERVAFEPAPARPAPASDEGPGMLGGPSLASAPVAPPPSRPADDAPTAHAVVEAYEAPLYTRPGGGARIGLARLSTLVPAEPTGDECSGGQWLRVSGGAYACTGDGLRLTGADAAPAGVPAPEWQQLLPYEYVRAARNAPRLSSMPRGDSDGDLRSVVERWMSGQHFLAVWRRVNGGSQEYYETIRGNFVRVGDVTVEPLRPMHGERLGDGIELPLAFALEETELHCVRGDAVAPCGMAGRHARFAVAERRDLDGVPFAVGGDGRALPVDAVRIVEAVERPDDIPGDARWIHIDLSQQALIAYEGDRAVYATLVSTGRAGFETPGGVFQVDRRYLSKTMRGQDEDGFYEVQEVPWTLYYDGNYAVHGAYWHDRFGNTKSHGCTNVPPADARWLYYWSGGLPRGWHARFGVEDTWVYVSGETPPDEDAS
jgi:hypothetical protein